MKSDTEEIDIDFFARWKTHWSVPVDEDNVLMHLSNYGGPILCGIDKTHPDVYNQGAEPIQDIVRSRSMICKRCFKSYSKLIMSIPTEE